MSELRENTEIKITLNTNMIDLSDPVNLLINGIYDHIQTNLDIDDQEMAIALRYLADRIEYKDKLSRGER